MKNLKYIIILICIIGISFGGTWYFFKNSRYTFNAETSNGKVSLADFKGENVILYFGYTYCADVCSMTLEVVNKAMENLASKGVKKEDVLVLFSSLDPERDTPQALTEYAKFFYPNSVGVKVSLEDLPKVAQNFGIKYEKMGMDNSAMNYSIAHSSALFLFNKQGELVDIVTNLTEENVEHALAKFLGI